MYPGSACLNGVSARAEGRKENKVRNIIKRRMGAPEESAAKKLLKGIKEAGGVQWRSSGFTGE